MSTLIIRRANAALQDAARNYIVLVDDQNVGRVANGAEVQIALEPGKHFVQLKLDWCRSPVMEIDAKMGAQVLLECGPTRPSYFSVIGIFWHITFNRKKYMWLRPVAANAA